MNIKNVGYTDKFGNEIHSDSVLMMEGETGFSLSFNCLLEIGDGEYVLKPIYSYVDGLLVPLSRDESDTLSIPLSDLQMDEQGRLPYLIEISSDFPDYFRSKHDFIVGHYSVEENFAYFIDRQIFKIPDPKLLKDFGFEKWPGVDQYMFLIDSSIDDYISYMDGEVFLCTESTHKQLNIHTYQDLADFIITFK